MVIVKDNKLKNKRYLPHELTTKINSVKLYRQPKDIDFILRRYHISKASLMRWNKLYDGTKDHWYQSLTVPAASTQCSYRARIELNPELPSSQPQHQHL